VKYVAFAAMVIVGIPAIALAATYRARLREWLVSAMVFAAALTGPGPFKINFVSMEAYRGPDRGFEVTLMDLLAVGLAISLLVRDRRRIAWIPWNTFWMFAYLGVAVLSIMDARDPILSWFTVFKLVRSYGLYWCTVNLLRAGVPLSAFWRGFVAAALYVAFVAVKQKYLHHVYRVNSVFDHPNILPLFLNQFLPLLLAVGLAETSVRRALLSLGAACAAILTVVLTFSRAGIALSMLSSLATLWYANRRAPSARVRAATVVAACAMLALGAVTARGVIARFQTAAEESAMARDEFNRAADRMVADHPLGVGVNQFTLVLSKAPEYRRFIEVMAGESQAGVCHHIFRLTLAETGWLGLAVFLVVILRLMARPAWQAMRRRGPDALFFAAMLFGAAALHLQGFLEWGFRVTSIFSVFMICSGLIVGYHDRLRMEEAEAARDPRWAYPPPGAPAQGGAA